MVNEYPCYGFYEKLVETRYNLLLCSQACSVVQYGLQKAYFTNTIWDVKGFHSSSLKAVIAKTGGL